MPPKPPADPERQLMIKTKVCQRIRKELEYYKKEVHDNETQLQEMKDQKKDPYDIKKFEEVVGESRMMVPDSERRLKEAVRELQQFLDSHDADLSDDSEWKSAAQDVLQKECSYLSDTSAKETSAPSTNVDDLKEGEAF